MLDLSSSNPPVRSSDTGRFVLGMGCERGTAPAEAVALAEEALRLSAIKADQLAAVASIDNRLDEPAILAVAQHLGLIASFFDSATLERETPRLKNPSDLVFARVGCHGVAEAAALASAGPGGELVLGKIRSRSATAAVARIG